MNNKNVETYTGKQITYKQDIKTMFTIHPHSSKSEPEKLSAVIGRRDGGKFS